MKSLYLDPETNDLVIDERMSLKTVSGIDEAAQHLRLLLLTRMGEWFLNTKHGLDHGKILGEKLQISETQIRAVIYDAVKHDSRDITIKSIDLDFNIHTRALTIKITATVNEDLVITELEL